MSNIAGSVHHRVYKVCGINGFVCILVYVDTVVDPTTFLMGVSNAACSLARKIHQSNLVTLVLLGISGMRPTSQSMFAYAPSLGLGLQHFRGRPYNAHKFFMTQIHSSVHLYMICEEISMRAVRFINRTSLHSFSWDSLTRDLLANQHRLFNTRFLG